MTQKPRSRDAYVQHVRSYPRAELLRKLSSAATRVANERMDGKPIHPLVVQEFTLAGVARTALARGNDHRSKEVTPWSVTRLCQEYLEVGHSTFARDSLDDLVRPFMFEQVLAQQSPMKNIARARALYEHHLPAVQDAPGSAELSEVLGVSSVSGYTRIGFMIHVIFTHRGGGVVSRGDLRPGGLVGSFSPWVSEEVVALMDSHYVSPVEAHSAVAREGLDAAPGGQEGIAFNPLQKWPLVDLGNEIVCPAPHFLIDKFSSTGLFYTLAAALGNRFTVALGHAFESYVGDQLSLLSAASVIPEIEYGKNRAKTCDFILLFDELVLLVEVKASRPPERFRQSQMPADGLSAFEKARTQLDRTAQLIRGGEPALSHIPRERPIKGLIVTFEPHFISGTEAQEDILMGLDGTPLIETSAHDLEDFCARHRANGRLGQNLLDAWRDASTAAFRGLQSVGDGDDRANNPILEEHFRRAVDLEEIWETFAGA